MILNEQQRLVVNAKDKNILCIASAGSGKTASLTERIRRILLEGEPAKNIVAISFTNQAAGEMKTRLGSIANGAYIGTLHSYANLICHDNNIDTTAWIENKTFDKIIKAAIKLPKSKFPKISHLLVDEFQDCSKEDIEFFNRLNAANRFYVGDSRQLIYAFRGSDESIFEKFYYRNDFEKYYLTKNYRCPQNIINFAEGYLNLVKLFGPTATAVKKEDGFIDGNCRFEDAVEEMTWTENWGAWAILCRSNNEVAVAQDYLSKKNIPFISFKKGDLDNEQMQLLLAENRVKILTIHSAKGLEFQNVIVTGARKYNADEKRIAYVAATRSQNKLYWCRAICKIGPKNRPKNFRDARYPDVISQISNGRINKF